MKKPFILLALSLSLLTSLSTAQTLAPGAPGKDAFWSTAGKQAIGTSASLESKIWFTLAQGVMTEVYYPDVTVANVQTLQFVVVNPKTKKVETETDDATHVIAPLRADSLSFRQINTAKSGQWTITKTYVTDPERDSVVVDVKFLAKSKGLNLYLYYDPSLGNTGMKDSAYSSLAWFGSQIPTSGFPIAAGKVDKKLKTGIGLGSDDGELASVVGISSAISEVTNGYRGVSDGLEQLRANGRITAIYSNAADGNVAQMARIDAPERFTFTLSFASGKTAAPTAAANAEKTLLKGFDQCLAEYEKGWSDYIKTIPRVDPKYQAQFNMAAMVLKAQEDKTVRGANVASLTVPWGGGVNANADVGGGYHLVWARDLYHVFTAYMALGDKPAAERALDFLFNIQQKEDGSFPQNSHLDGKCGWCSLQLDEVAYPLIMAWQLGRFDKPTYEKHVKRAADFLVRNGPKTPQERWEEEAGFSPSTIAAEIAGLVCAADIAKKNGDEASAIIYLAAADDWARNVERWTATTTGKFGDGNYYLRITQNGDPDAGDKIELNNGAGTFDERTVVDAGFLELVRLGIKPADDPLIAKSIKIIDEQIRTHTPNGDTFYRYTKDGYGEMDDGRRWNYDGKYTGKGRPWPLLTGERGQYEIAKCGTRTAESSPRPASRTSQAETRPVGSVSNATNARCWASANGRLDAMLAFANDGLMIPEQVWDKKEVPATIDPQYIPPLKWGEGTGSATPLAWSMAQFIRLATNLKAGRNLDTPRVVYDRYKDGIPTQTNDFGGQESFVLPHMKTGEVLKVSRDAPAGSRIAYTVDGETHLVTADEKGKYSNDFKIPAGDAIGIAGVLASDGSTAFERIRMLKQPAVQELTPSQLAAAKTAKQSPLIMDGKAIFIYRGPAKHVELAGDMNGWQPGRIFLQRIDTDLQAAAVSFAPTARAEYKFIVDGA